MCLQRLQQVSKNTSLVRKHKLNKYYHLLNVKYKYVQGESKKSGISKSMYIALRAIKIKQIKF